MLLITLSLLALPPLATDASEPEPVAVLRAWDQARAAAYLTGSAAALRELYVDDAPAGRADLKVLEGYRERGLRVWIRTQVFDAEPQKIGEHRIVLRVSDRTHTVVGDGVRCLALPTTQPEQRTLTLVHRAGEWQVLSVRRGQPVVRR